MLATAGPFGPLWAAQYRSGEGEITMTITGGCLCGNVRYEVTQTPVWAHNCHCSRCRKVSGGAFASTFFVPEDAFSYTRGDELLRRFEVAEAETFNNVFCTRCGSTLPFRPLIPGLIGVPMGTVDGDPQIEPRAHIFADSKASWVTITDSLPQHAEGFQRPDP